MLSPHYFAARRLARRGLPTRYAIGDTGGMSHHPNFPPELSDLGMPHSHDFGGMGHLLVPAVRRGGLPPNSAGSFHRNVVADWLEDYDRHEEAALLRDPAQHVEVVGGVVRRGR